MTRLFSRKAIVYVGRTRNHPTAWLRRVWHRRPTPGMRCAAALGAGSMLYLAVR